MSAVREDVSGGVAIQDIPAKYAKVHIPTEGGIPTPNKSASMLGVTSITYAKNLRKYMVPSIFFRLNLSE